MQRLSIYGDGDPYCNKKEATEIACMWTMDQVEVAIRFSVCAKLDFVLVVLGGFL